MIVHGVWMGHEHFITSPTAGTSESVECYCPAHQRQQEPVGRQTMAICGRGNDDKPLDSLRFCADL
jgi:hypothetical protein